MELEVDARERPVVLNFALSSMLLERRPDWSNDVIVME